MPWTDDSIKSEKGKYTDHLTTGELARFLGVALRTVHRWEASGKLPKPAQTTNLGWKLYSPTQVTEILRERIK